MTVEEIINKLKKMPKTFEVWVEEPHVIRNGLRFSYKPKKVEKINVMGTKEKRVLIR